MKTFLQLLAKDIIDKYGEEFDALTILFPNKRAGLFLAEELSQLITRPVWMPEIMTLGEFIGQFTGLRQAETLPLSIKLYKAYASISGSKERFDDFYFWGNMLLGDFDDIDKYLVDARDLFSNLSALKDLENSPGMWTVIPASRTKASRNSSRYGTNFMIPTRFSVPPFSSSNFATKA